MLFGDAEPEPTEPREDPLDELDDALFGDPANGDGGGASAGVRADPSVDGGRRRRLGLAALVVLLVLGLGGVGYAVFGRSDGARGRPKVEVRGSEVTRATVPTTTTSTTTPPSTTTTIATTSTTTPAPATVPPIVVPPTAPPPTGAPPTAPPPPTAAPTTTTAAPTTTTTTAAPPQSG